MYHWKTRRGDGAVVTEISRVIGTKMEMSSFRSSKNLKRALKFIVETCVMPSIKYTWGRQSITFNARLNALMKLGVSFLCVPTISSALFGLGLMSSQQSKDTDEGKEPQLRYKLTSSVLELFAILMASEQALRMNDDCDEAVDDRRINLLIDLICLRRSPLIPFVITVSENCPEALAHMSCHVLAVSALATEITEVIDTVTKHKRHLISHDIRGLTTEIVYQVLKPEFVRYFAWLRQHQEGNTASSLLTSLTLSRSHTQIYFNR